MMPAVMLVLCQCSRVSTVELEVIIEERQTENVARSQEKVGEGLRSISTQDLYS